MKKILISFLVGVLLLTPFSGVGASSEYSKEELKEINKISEELQFYFDEIGEIDSNGNYHIHNMELLKERANSGDETAKNVYEIYSETKTNESEIGTMSAVDFGKCVVGKFVESYGNVARAFLKGAIFQYIKNKQWDLAAHAMFDALKLTGKVASAASVAVEAAIYGWQCRGEF